MNIYFVNRYSKLKGPFDIIDSNRQHIIKVGDICLRDTFDGIAFYVIYNSSNTWNACKLVGLGTNETLSEVGNTLLFSFDGLSRRKGNIALIKLLAQCFRERVIDDFFNNAIDILEYKKDYWDGSLFPQFFASSQELVNRDEQKKSDISIETKYYPTVFAQYLTKELQELLLNSLNEGKELKEAYLILREKHPELFRKALLQFLTDNPSGSIYDKPADEFVPIVKEVETPKKISRNDRIFEPDESIDVEPLEINKGIEHFLTEIGREPLLSTDEEVELAQKIRKGEIDARNKLVSANIRYVVAIAKQYIHNGLEFEDLLQEGIRGLIKAANHYDETRGFKFIHYALLWIRRSITEAIANDLSLIRFPLNAHVLHRKICNFKNKYEKQNGFMPPTAYIEIEDEDNLDKISFHDTIPINLKNTCISCDNLDVFEGSDNDIIDYEDNENKRYYVRSLLARLPKRERDILIRVFGIGVREETLEMIGESRGLTRERVRQIKEKAIRKLREKVFSSSTERQLSESQSTREVDSIGHAVATKSTEGTQTLREVKKTFSQSESDIVKLTETKKGNSVNDDKVILLTGEASSKDVDLNTCNYTIVNFNGKCNIYGYNKRLIYSSTGYVKEINKSHYRLSLTQSFFSIGLIKRNRKGELYNADKILLAKQQTKLYRKLHRKNFVELIEDIEFKGRRRVKVDGCWFDERGNEVIVKNVSDSGIMNQHEVEKNSVEGNDTIEPNALYEIDKMDVEHVYVDTLDAFPYREVEVEVEQSDNDKTSKRGEPLPIWTFAENIRFTKRSKQFLKCKCCVGLSKAGYFLIINHRFIKLGDYPYNFDCNVGNIWIKKPIDDKGYRIIHEKEKECHLIGYAIEKGEKVVFKSPENDVYSVSFDGKITSSVKNKNTIPLKDTDIDKLRHAFDKKATSYKYFWFLAILKIHNEIRMDTILFKDILIKMVSLAWGYVFCARYQFPSQDQLPVYLRTIQTRSFLTRSTKEKKVEEMVRESFYEQKWNTLLMPLLNNVPYRFLSPWIPFTTNEEVSARSKITESRCPYCLHNDHITVNHIWSDFLLENYDKMIYFIEEDLRNYLKCNSNKP